MKSIRGWLAALIMALTGAQAVHAATKIVFLYTAVPSYIGSFVAKDEGLFEEYDLDVELIMAATGSIIPAAMVAGSAQVGAPTPTVLLQANDGGLDLVYFAGCDVYPTQSKTGILARVGSNLQGPKDLPGKKDWRSRFQRHRRPADTQVDSISRRRREEGHVYRIAVSCHA